MIQVTRADDLEKKAWRLENEATELEATGEDTLAERKRAEAAGCRQLATKMRAARTDGVRFS